MNKTMTIAARAMTICIAPTLGYNAAVASAVSLSHEQLVTDAPLEYVVRFPDLDISRIEGAAALYARLRGAARAVCEPLESRELALAAKHRVCIDKAITDAVASVNRPLLSQYHQLRTKSDRVGPVQIARVD
jgi:UrcA family protein